LLGVDAGGATGACAETGRVPVTENITVTIAYMIQSFFQLRTLLKASTPTVSRS
jgi:hypothetical protein